MDMISKTSRGEGGFTLVEIAVAVVILAVGMTTLISIQTQQLAAYLHERNLFKASLYAQYIMTALEIEEELPDEGSDSGDLESLLRELGYFEYEPSGKATVKQEDEVDGWRWEQQVESRPVFEIEDALRRIVLTIHWGEKKSSKMKLVYMAYVSPEQRE